MYVQFYEHHNLSELFPKTAYNVYFRDTELKYLRGPSGVAEVLKQVTATKNFSLLERLLVVVETKEQSKLDVQSCNDLLRMLTR